MTTLAILTLGDAQLQPEPCVWPAQVIEVYSTWLAVLHRFYPVLNANGLPIHFPVIVCWASDPGETQAWSVAFSAN